MDAVLVGEEDPAFAGGSYVIVQKYLHDLDGWNALSTEAQERIIGRTKLSDIELRRFRQANLRAQRTHNHCRGRERDQDPARQHAIRPGQRTVNSAPTSSATAVRPAPSNRCSKTCSSAGRPATMTGCSISAARSRETCFLLRPRHFWKPWAKTSPPWWPRLLL